MTPSPFHSWHTEVVCLGAKKSLSQSNAGAVRIVPSRAQMPQNDPSYGGPKRAAHLLPSFRRSDSRQ